MVSFSKGASEQWSNRITTCKCFDQSNNFFDRFFILRNEFGVIAFDERIVMYDIDTMLKLEFKLH